VEKYYSTLDVAVEVSASLASWSGRAASRRRWVRRLNAIFPDIAGLVGIGLGAASRRIAVVVDGFIGTAAAMLAVELFPRVRGHLIAAPRSVEVGQRMVLESLALEPLDE
jgi:hypothetical protein